MCPQRCPAQSTVTAAPHNRKGTHPASRRLIRGRKTGAPSSPRHRRGLWVSPDPRSAPSSGSMAAARRFSQKERPSLTCDWRERDSLIGVSPSPFETQQQSAMAAAARAPVNSFRTRGCFTPGCPQDCSTGQPKFRLLGVPPPVPQLSMSPRSPVSPHRPKGASGVHGNKQRGKYRSVPDLGKFSVTSVFF